MIGLLQLLDHYIWLNALKLLIIYLRHLDVNIIFIIYFMPKKSWLLGDLNFKHLMRLQHHWLCLIRILYRFHLRMVQVLFSLIKLDQLSGIDLFVIRHQVLNFGAFIRADVAWWDWWMIVIRIYSLESLVWIEWPIELLIRDILFVNQDWLEHESQAIIIWLLSIAQSVCILQQRCKEWSIILAEVFSTRIDLIFTYLFKLIRDRPLIIQPRYIGINTEY